ncbi:hypothetical protein THAOC_21303 [Thalassiosira oceanica]|uniref:Helicase ATP-binding domain-containing protein n=1 Tax=Thalassiosira oceanica TaxID=159749 RepID=K0S1D2_THAOC|nr:hypothetical protein THAOC_21303 [Thalassiosira oceanica]|eukprot:EJK58564.1 hypothetical protein THAOC_21303 [Thalassiosira oceanica]
MAGFTCSVCTFAHQFTAQRCQMCGALRVTKGQMREFVKTGKIEAGESTKQKQSGHGRRDGRSSSKSAPAKSSATTKKRSSSLPAPSKRQKVNHDSKTSHEAGGVPTPASRVIGDARPKSKGRNNQAEHASGRLILCKRWTVASSNSPRGRVRYNEALQFHRPKNSANSGGGAAAKPIDPIVRFRSASGSGDGTLNRYLSSILSPLLWHDASSQGGGPMVTLEATCLMEETLVMGSEIPISLHVYVNDPHAFFGLFDGGDDASNSSLFFGRKGAGLPSSGKMPSYQGKRARSSFSRDELAEAAFHLLQWAEKGEEMPFEVKTTSDDGEGQGTEEFTDNEEKDGGDNAEESEEVNELNQLVASDDGKQVKSLPELSDPTGFKPDVVLRPYQRQALHFMCQREGCHIEGEMDGDSAAQGGEDEMALLAELAGQIRDGQSSMPPSGDEPVACDCGPVLVDGTIASSASPVCYHGRTGAINGKAFVHHPLWKRRFLATDDLRTVYSFYVNELLGVASATPPNAPEPAVGGILADAMGLGKTVELLSLILKSKEALNSTKEIKPPPVARGSDEVVNLLDDSDSESSSMDDDEEWTEESEKRGSAAKRKTVTSQRRTKGTTLVVAPLSLVSQWEDEVATKTDLSQIVYYDSSKKLAGCDSFSSVDVVVTTYGTLQSEYVALSKTGMSMQPNHTHPLLKFSWQRVILDEAHGIKNPATVVSKACCLLQAKSRWCVTGTPIQNSLQADTLLEDVYGLLKFLRHEPWCEANFWKSAITDTLSSSESSDDKAGGQDEDDRSPHELAASAAFARVRRVLAPIIIRRTKDTLTEDGKPILTLPPVDSSVVKVNLSPDEREFYDACELERMHTSRVKN